MKLISFIVPCFNDDERMINCIDRLLKVSKDVEIIIINNGSSDQTQVIADAYMFKYPSVIRVFHKDHISKGALLNFCLKIAKGVYFKVIYPKDWLQEKALIKLISQLRDCLLRNLDIHLFICNCVSIQQSKVIHHLNALPVHKVFTWSETKGFKSSQLLTMEGLVYKTSVLRDAGLSFPLSVEQVENFYVCQPLICVHRMYYMPIELYYLNTYKQLLLSEDQYMNDLLYFIDIFHERKCPKKLYDYLLKHFIEMLDQLPKHCDQEKVWLHLEKNNKGLYYKLRILTFLRFDYMRKLHSVKKLVSRNKL